MLTLLANLRPIAFWPLWVVLLALLVLNFSSRSRRLHGINAGAAHHYGWPATAARVRTEGPSRPWGSDRSDELGAWLINAVIAGVTLATSAIVVWLWPASDRRFQIRHLLLLQVVAALIWLALPPPTTGGLDKFIEWVSLLTVSLPYPLALYALVRTACTPGAAASDAACLP